MSKKYIPKYHPTSYEGFDSDEAHRIVKNIGRYTKRQFVLEYIIFMLFIIAAVLLGVLLIRYGG